MTDDNYPHHVCTCGDCSESYEDRCKFEDGANEEFEKRKSAEENADLWRHDALSYEAALERVEREATEPGIVAIAMEVLHPND